MIKQVVFFSAILFSFSIAFSQMPTQTVKFDLGANDAENDCVNEYLKLDLRLKSFEKAHNLGADSFSYSVGNIEKKIIGHRGSYWSCEARVTSNISNFVPTKSKLSRHFGANRNSECELDLENAYRDPGVLGVEINFDQGFTFNPYCQSFQLSIF